MVDVSVGLTVSWRAYLSIQHIQSAAIFTRQAAKIEEEYIESNNRELYHEHKSYVTGAIFATIAFLEANINEIFADCFEGVPSSSLKELGKEKLELIGDVWDIPKTAHYSMLDKYQIVLILAQKEKFNKGVTPYQDIQIPIRLRNSLIHYEPGFIVTHSDEPEEITRHKFEKSLRNKFSLSPLVGAGNPFFPDRCLSYGCAKWAIESSLRFTDEFFSRLKVKPTYDHVRDKLILE